MPQSASALRIEIDDASRPAVVALLEEHLAFARRVSPPRSGHALPVDGLRQPGVTFWTAWDANDVLAGCAALRELSPTHGELKTMRTAITHLRRGVASALLKHVMSEAGHRGLKRLSLETGSGDAFDPAIALYERSGFERCPPFADYVADGFSVFMTRAI